MLTIKHVNPSYQHVVREATEVRFWSEEKPEVARMTNEDTHRHFVTTDIPGCDPWTFSDGKVYVMNDHGSTVAQYDLGGWRGPSESKHAA